MVKAIGIAKGLEESAKQLSALAIKFKKGKFDKAKNPDGSVADDLVKETTSLKEKFDFLHTKIPDQGNLKAKFLADFRDNPEGFLDWFKNDLDRLKGWEDLASIGKTVAGNKLGHGLRMNKLFIDKYIALSPPKRLKMKTYLDNQIAFKDKKGWVSYSASRNIDIGDGVPKTYDANYDATGHIEFEKYCPPGFNTSSNNPKLVEHFTPGKTNLNGNTNDFTAANKWLKEEFPNKDITIVDDNFILTENGVSIKYTWHHHQDLTSIFPVPTPIHNNSTIVNLIAYKGFPHSGGVSLYKQDPEFKNFFPPPNF